MTADSHKIAVRHLRKSGDEAVILAHGFSTHKDMALFKEMSEIFHQHYDVLTFDFRGHGESGGLFSWTSHEAHDLHAVAQIETAPILFMHGGSDWLIRPHHSEKLFKAAKTPKELRIIPEAGHAEMIFDQSPEKFESICMEWFKKTLEAD